MKKELVEPIEVIDQYNIIWEGDIDKDYILLWSDYKVNIHDYDCLKVNYNEMDNKLKECFKLCRNSSESDFKTAIKNLDTIYHTRLSVGGSDFISKTARNIYDKKDKLFDLLEKIQSEDDNDTKKEMVDVVACINKFKDESSNYIYSFATKFCSFLSIGYIDKDCFPIFDSVASTLLYKYLKQKYNEQSCSHTQMGDYGYYLNQFEIFIKKAGLEKKSYKEIDIFLWLYGTLMNEYWKTQGIIKFDSILYIAPCE